MGSEGRGNIILIMKFVVLKWLQCFHHRPSRAPCSLDWSHQGPNAPYRCWWVGQQTSNIFAVRQLHSGGVGWFYAPSPTKISCLSRGWRTSWVTVILKQIKNQHDHTKYIHLCRYFCALIFYLSGEFGFSLFDNFHHIAYFVQGCQYCIYSIVIIERETDNLATLYPPHNSAGCGMSK